MTDGTSAAQRSKRKFRVLLIFSDYKKCLGSLLYSFRLNSTCVRNSRGEMKKRRAHLRDINFFCLHMAELLNSPVANEPFPNQGRIFHTYHKFPESDMTSSITSFFLYLKKVLNRKATKQLCLLTGIIAAFLKGLIDFKYRKGRSALLKGLSVVIGSRWILMEEREGSLGMYNIFY